MSATISLDPGNKNLELNVTNQIMNALTGNMRYYGFLLKLPNDLESSTASSYWRKSFYMGDFTVLANLPRLDITYDQYVADDRDKMIAGSSGSLYFYNFINGNPTSIGYSGVTAQIVNENDTVVTSTTSVVQDANYTAYYKAILTIPVSS